MDETSERQVRDVILDSIADGVFTVDSDWNITSFNRAAEEITGISAEKAIGQKCFDVFKANICQASCALRETMQSGRRVVDRAAESWVGGATADVAGNGLDRVAFIPAWGFDEVAGEGDHETRSAEPTLRCPFIGERELDRSGFPPVETFDGDHVAACNGPHREETRGDHLVCGQWPVDLAEKDHARSAVSLTARVLDAGELRLVSQVVER